MLRSKTFLAPLLRLHPLCKQPSACRHAARAVVLPKNPATVRLFATETVDWSKAAEDFDRVTPFTMRFSKECIDDLKLPVELGKDTLVLDIAAGTGSFALMVANRSTGSSAGRILATDLNSSMVEVMKAKIQKQLPAEKQQLIECRVMDGQNLEIPNDSVSHAACVFGVMFYPDRLKGLKEMHRVLKPGSCVSIAVWKKTSFLSSMEQIALKEGKITQDQIPLPATKMVLCYAEASAIKQDLIAAGFKEGDIQIRESTHSHEFPIATMVQTTLSNPVTKTMGLSKEALEKHFSSGASSPGNTLIDGTANIVLARKSP